jgi:hypothetical protein
MRLIQLLGPEGRRTGVVEGDFIRLLGEARSVYSLAQSALAAGIPLAEAAAADAGSELAGYDEIYAGVRRGASCPRSITRLEPARCMVSGTGLSHIRSASNRQAMHAAGEQITDSMRMYQWGVEAAGRAGSRRSLAGVVLQGHGVCLCARTASRSRFRPLRRMAREEPEIAGIYLIDSEGTLRRIGMAAGNEFSDHVSRSELSLPGGLQVTHLRLGPELAVAPEFGLVRGEVAIERAGE